MKRGIMKITPESLADRLALPSGTEIDSASWDPIDRTITLSVLHPELPEVPNRMAAPFVTPRVSWR